MQPKTPSRITRPNNTGNVTPAEFNYIHDLYGRMHGKNKIKEIAEFQHRSYPCIKDIVAAKSFEEYCKIRPQGIKRNSQRPLFSAIPEGITSPVNTKVATPKQAPQVVYAPDQAKKDYTGAILSVVSDLRGKLTPIATMIAWIQLLLMILVLMGGYALMR